MSSGDPALGERLGEVELTRLVARGGMATVFAARRVHDGHTVALKLLHPMRGTPEAKTRFQREFHALSKLRHPGILRVHDSGTWEDRPWYTMEYLTGQPLRDAVKSWATIEPDERFRRAESVLGQVATALAYIHDRGLIHRDVTPTNIMVGEDGKAMLMDFGVVKEMDGTEYTQMGEVIGTVAYIAPEQVEGHELDARADLYSLGAVLYLMLTGKRPFSARTLRGYLDKHLHKTPRPPREVQPLVPRHLDEICIRLLHKAPGDRYASAHHVLHVLGRNDDDVRWPPRALVGRPLLRARMQDLVTSVAANGAGRATLVRGSGGQGKTTMLNHVEALANEAGIPVARGRCRPHDRPFGPFVGIYEKLRQETANAVLDGALLGMGPLDGRQERYPVIAALKDVVVARAPCAIIIDDVHEADPATTELLEYLIRNTLELADEPVAITISEDSRYPSRVTRRLPVERHLLKGFSASQVEELVVSALEDDPATRALAARLHTESDGKPALLSDMLRALYEESLIRRVDGRWRLTLDATRLADATLPLPASLRDALEERTRGISAGGLEVARTIAVARRSLDVNALTTLVDLDEDTIMDGVDELVDAQIALERGDDEHTRIELSHKRFRDVLLEPQGSEAYRRRHRLLGEYLERLRRKQIGTIVEELAWHFEQAEATSKAYAYLLQTAERHQQRSLFEESVSFLDRALELEPAARTVMPLAEADRRLAELHLSKAQANFQLGRWEEALQSARAADNIASELGDARQMSRIAAVLGDLLRSRGNLDESEAQLRRALQLADSVGDHDLKPMPLYWLGGLLWARGELERPERLWNDALAAAQRCSDDRASGYGYNGLGILAICRGKSIEARRNLEQSASIFEGLGMLGPLAIAQVNLTELYLSMGILRKAIQLAERTIGKAREVHHAHGIALGLAYRAQVLLALGRTEEATQNCDEALRVVRRLGNVEDEILILANRASIALVRGHAAQTVADVESIHALLAGHDGEGLATRAAAWQADGLAQLGDEERARSILSEDIQSPPWPHVQVKNDLAVGRAWARLGDVERASKHLLAGLELADANHYRLYQLEAHHALAMALDGPARARHARVGQALAQSLAGNLPTTDKATFLERWRMEASET